MHRRRSVTAQVGSPKISDTENHESAKKSKNLLNLSVGLNFFGPIVSIRGTGNERRSAFRRLLHELRSADVSHLSQRDGHGELHNLRVRENDH